MKHTTGHHITGQKHNVSAHAHDALETLDAFASGVLEKGTGIAKTQNTKERMYMKSPKLSRKRRIQLLNIAETRIQIIMPNEMNLLDMTLEHLYLLSKFKDSSEIHEYDYIHGPIRLIVTPPLSFNYPTCQMGHPTRIDGSHIKLEDYKMHLRSEHP